VVPEVGTRKASRSPSATSGAAPTAEDGRAAGQPWSEGRHRREAGQPGQRQAGPSGKGRGPRRGGLRGRVGDEQVRRGRRHPRGEDLGARARVGGHDARPERVRGQQQHQ
jgi:hypothetical protein